MSKKPLRPRRQRTVTVSNAVIKLPGAPTNAQLDIDPAGADNTIRWRALQPGVGGNSILVEYVNPGVASSPLSLKYVNKKITVSLATNGGGAITTTAQQVIDAVNASRDLLDVVRAIPILTVTGVVTAMPATPLAGGVDGTGDFLVPFTHALITIDPTNGVRAKSDGTDPAAADGQSWAGRTEIYMDDSFLNYREVLENLRLIRAGGTDGVLSIEYYEN